MNRGLPSIGGDDHGCDPADRGRDHVRDGYISGQLGGLDSLTVLQKGFKRNAYSAVPMASGFHARQLGSITELDEPWISGLWNHPRASPAAPFRAGSLGLLMQPFEEGEAMGDQQLPMKPSLCCSRATDGGQLGHLDPSPALTRTVCTSWKKR